MSTTFGVNGFQARAHCAHSCLLFMFRNSCFYFTLFCIFYYYYFYFFTKKSTICPKWLACPLPCLLAMLHVMQKKKKKNCTFECESGVTIIFSFLFVCRLSGCILSTHVYININVYIVCFKVWRETWSSDVTIKPLECSQLILSLVSFGWRL